MNKLLILIPILFLVACNPAADKSASVVRSNTTSVGGLNTAVTCANGTSAVGQIYDTTATAASFEARVKALLSATISSSEVGTISATASNNTGVIFNGAIKLDASGNIVAASSSMSIKVYDSYTLSGSDPIALEFASSKSSQISGQFSTSTGVGYVSFSDNYGIVRFDGTLNAQTFSGVVRFQNTANVDGGAAQSGTLGQFTVARCGIIQ
ncbi:MAG: hypothetical protein H7256_11945 [Bdellovibrio sp.]|nr:hypothetical protein [Bdellovibrio sp.]